VRDDATRESFKKEIGRIGVTLYVRSFYSCFRYLVATRTIFNSKGLEYDDVSSNLFTNWQPALTLWMCACARRSSCTTFLTSLHSIVYGNIL
jgi:hypothetical protein